MTATTQFQFPKNQVAQHSNSLPHHVVFKPVFQEQQKDQIFSRPAKVNQSFFSLKQETQENKFQPQSVIGIPERLYDDAATNLTYANSDSQFTKVAHPFTFDSKQELASCDQTSTSTNRRILKIRKLNDVNNNIKLSPIRERQSESIEPS